MRHVVTLFVAISCIPSHSRFPDPLGRSAAGQRTDRAYEVLTREVVGPFTDNTKVIDLISPQEAALGTSDTASGYGGVHQQCFLSDWLTGR